MKKAIALILTFVLFFGLTACTNDSLPINNSIITLSSDDDDSNGVLSGDSVKNSEKSEAKSKTDKANSQKSDNRAEQSENNSDNALSDSTSLAGNTSENVSDKRTASASSEGKASSGEELEFAESSVPDEPLVSFDVGTAGITYVSNGDGTCKVKSLAGCTDEYVCIPRSSPSGERVVGLCGTLTGENGNSTVRAVWLPDTVKGELKGCFYKFKALEKVVLSPNVTALGDMLFYGCNSLISVDFADSKPVSVGKNAFSGCSSLTNIDLPDSVAAIDDLAFSSCENLVQVTYGKSLTSIGERAFERLKKLSVFKNRATGKNLDGITGFGQSAFYNTGLSSITFSSNLTGIPGKCFSGCSKLGGTLDLRNTKITWLGENCFSSTSITGVLLPDTLETIGNGAFYSDLKLKSITLPDSVTRLGYQALGYCTALESVTLGSALTSISKEAFIGVTAPIVWHSPTIKNLSSGAFAGYCGTELYLPNSLTHIDSGALKDCNRLNTVSIPFVGPDSKDTSYSTDCFGWLFGEVDCWEQVNSVPSSIKQVRISGSCKIGARNFMSLGITSVVVGKNVTSISYSAFENCNSIKAVYYEGTASQWEAINFSKELKAGKIYTSPDWYYNGNQIILK